MAQDLNNNIGLTITANAGQADAEFVQLNKMLGEIVKTAGELNKQEFVSKSQVDNLKALSDQFISLTETSKITDEQFNNLQASFEQVEQRAMSPVFIKFREQFEVLDNQVEQFANNLQSLVPSSVFDESALSTLTKANKLYEETYKIINDAYEKGQISSGSYNNLMERLTETGKNYNDVLKEQGVSYERVARYQKALADISNGSALKALMEQSTVGKMSADEAKKAADEEQRRVDSINKINKEYNDFASKQQADEERQRRINEYYEKRARDEEEFNKRREDALKRQAELQENLNKTYSELGGGGLSAPDGAFADSIQGLADLNNIDTNNFFELFNKLGIGDKLLQRFSSELGVSVKDLKALAEAAGVTVGSLVGLVTAVGAVVVAIKLLVDQAQDMKKTFDNVALSLGEFAGDSFQWFVDSLESVVDIAEQAIGTLEKLADAGIDLERAFLTTSAYIGQEATDNVYNFINSISSASNTMFASINDVVAAAGSMGLASDQLVEATENMTIMGRNLGVLIGDTKKAFLDLGQTISKGYVGRNSILYRIFTKQEIEQVRKLGSEVEQYNFILERSGRVQDLYNEYIQTAAGKVSLLRMQWQEMLTNIGTIALNLYAIVAPVLTKILTIANQLLSVLISVFGWEPKSVGFNSVAADIGQSLEDVAGSAAKANKQLASFDDVIQINDNKSSGGGGVGGIDPQALGDFSGLLDDALNKSNDFVNLWEHFKELMSTGDYFGAGEEFMKVISKLLENIPWDDIKKKAGDVGEAIAKFLNGIFNVDNEDILKAWQNVGKTIAEALNTVITAVGSFLKEFDFNMMGKALGQAWDSLWDNLDTEGAAEALYEAFMGVFEFVLGWLEGGGLSRMAEGIADIISNFFKNFDIETDTDTIVNAVVGVIDDIINALYTVVEALTSDDVRKVVFTLIEKLVGAFKDNAADWGQKLNTIASDIMSFLSDAMTTADNAGLQSAIGTFLENLKLGDLLHQYIELKVQAWLTAFGTKTKYMIDSVGGLILKVLEELLYRIAYIIGQLIGNILKLLYNLGAKIGEALWGIGEAVFGWLGTFIGKVLGDIIGLFANIIIYAIAFGTGIITKIKEILTFIGEALSDFVTFIITGIANLGVSIGNGIAGIAESVGAKVGEFIELLKSAFNDFWEFIKGIFDVEKWAELGTKVIDGLWNAIKSIWNNTIGSLSLDIPGIGDWEGIHVAVPKLATGGIITGPTTALIGEAGAEAVLPLKNNTQWMDILASKVANQITSGNGINGGTIRLELTDKPFYTRAEMYEFGALVAQSLNAYGINIAVV